MLKYNMEYRKGILFIRLAGSLNKETAINFNTYFIPMILKNGIKNIVYNLSYLDNIDATGIEALEDGKKAIAANKGLMYLCNVPYNINLTSKLQNIIIKDELSMFKLMEI